MMNSMKYLVEARSFERFGAFDVNTHASEFAKSLKGKYNGNDYNTML
jgi:hypothetical protein